MHLIDSHTTWSNGLEWLAWWAAVLWKAWSNSSIKPGEGVHFGNNPSMKNMANKYSLLRMAIYMRLERVDYEYFRLHRKCWCAGPKVPWRNSSLRTRGRSSWSHQRSGCPRTRELHQWVSTPARSSVFSWLVSWLDMKLSEEDCHHSYPTSPNKRQTCSVPYLMDGSEG